MCHVFYDIMTYMCHVSYNDMQADWKKADAEMGVLIRASCFTANCRLSLQLMSYAPAAVCAPASLGVSVICNM
jgi:hypothetical protein